jgi:methionyl aminopeptidase
VSDRLHVPEHITRPSYALSKPVQESPPARPIRKSRVEVNGVREACQLAKKMLLFSETLIKPGVTTDFIDRCVHAEIIGAGAYPSPLSYRGFPKSVCTSVNNVACHGIPDSYVLQEGDIINVDITVFFKGFHGDTSQTFAVGKIDTAATTLIQTVNECLALAVKACKPFQPFSIIGETIEPYARARGFTVCQQFCGHGIGRSFHEEPTISHALNHDSTKMLPGHTFTIEPILNEGKAQVMVLRDGWTAVTIDGMRSAQCEHTVLITDQVCE